MAKRNQATVVRESDQLDARLRDYSALARVSGAVKTLHRRIGNWPIYAAVTGSALAMATSASASIITGTYVGGAGPHGGAVVQTNLPSVHYDLSFGLTHGAGVKDFIHLKADNPMHSHISVSGVPPAEIFSTRFFAPGTSGSGFPSFVRNFAFGNIISAGVGNHRKSALVAASAYSGKNYGAFLSGQPGYLGFAVKGTGTDFDYGWLKLEFFTNAQSKIALEALSFGVQTTSNESINAGDTGAPEPGTMALGILAAGAAGVMALRRRRKQAVEVTAV